MKETLPQYRMIYNRLLKKINKGEYQINIPIPSENELALKYSVSRMTARKSVDMLVNEGYLVRYKGKGTFITGRKNLIKDEVSLTARLKEKGLRVFNDVKCLTLTDITDETVLAAMAVGASPCPMWVVERVRYVNDIPAIYETVYLPKAILATMDETMAKASLTSLLEGIGDIGKLEVTAQPAVFGGRKKARELQVIKGDPCLKVLSTVYFMDGTPGLYSESLQNTKVLPFTMVILR